MFLRNYNSLGFSEDIFWKNLDKLIEFEIQPLITVRPRMDSTLILQSLPKLHENLIFLDYFQKNFACRTRDIKMLIGLFF